MRTLFLLLAAALGVASPVRSQTVLYAEDFESGYAAWSMDSLWNAQEASESCTAYVAPFPSGTHAVWYGSSSFCNFAPSDWDDHFLTCSTPIVLPATTGVLELRFRSHSNAEEDGVWDLRHVQFSTNDGGTWTRVGDVFNGWPGWKTEVFDVTRFAGSTVRLRFRFWAGDGWGNEGIGWLIDDLEIVERDASAVVQCLGDGTWRTCPCGNNGATGRGCATSFNPDGARLAATGVASVGADTLAFTGDGMSTAAATIVQAASNWETPFENIGGDGWACMRGPYARIRTIPAVGGAIAYPAGDVPISVRGNVPPAGGQRFYTVRYRNAASFCTASTFNVTNGLSVTWRP